MSSISQIDYRLYVGDSQSSKDESLLRFYGITAIVNVAKDLNDPWIDGIKSLKIGLMDGDSLENKGLYYIAAESVIRLICDGETVLLHCHEGRSRSCAIAVLVELFFKYTSLEEAMNHVLKHRPATCIKPGHMKHLSDTANKIGLVMLETLDQK